MTCRRYLHRLGHVAEGVYTAREVHHLAQRLGVAMPICEAVYRIIYEHISAAEVIAELLNRTPNQNSTAADCGQIPMPCCRL